MNILHLEDDYPLREVLKLVLVSTDSGIAIHQFVGSDEALAYIQNKPLEIDLFILDVRIPGVLDGMDLAQIIRDLGCDSPIVITSAYERPNPLLLTTLKCEWMPKPWKFGTVAPYLLSLVHQHNEGQHSVSV